MRRSLSEALKKLTGDLRSPERAAGAGEVLSLHLECITPVVGGGVEAREPDRVDVVRVPGIRGLLRHWWRQVGDPADLFKSERALFGGVSSDEGTDRSTAGKLSVSVEILDAGRVVPAGFHPANPSGGWKALPEWSGHKELGYALFPLARAREELKRVSPNADRVATRSIREGLRFALTLRLRGVTDTERERLLCALWAFIHFGGIGARTTRGFGALAVMDDGASLSDFPRPWETRFARPSVKDLDTRLKLPSTGAQWGHLGDVLIYRGPAESQPSRAHAAVVGALKEFRQGVNLGRCQGRDRREGQSNWPEAHVFRLLAEAEGNVRGGWEHAPPSEGRELYKQGESWAVPRAAFGLPIQVTFKDRMDSRANGMISGRDTDRWTSPLRLRPIACKEGQFVPVAILALDKESQVPGDVRVKLTTQKVDANATVAVDPARNGAEPPIRGYLATPGNHGDATRAFLDCLVQKFRFQRAG